MNKIISLLFICLAANTIFAQDAKSTQDAPETWFLAHSFSGALGSNAGELFGLSYNAHLQQEKSLLSYAAGINAGALPGVAWGVESSLLLGKKGHYAEFGLAYNRTFWLEIDGDYTPYYSVYEDWHPFIAYRFERTWKTSPKDKTGIGVFVRPFYMPQSFVLSIPQRDAYALAAHSQTLNDAKSRNVFIFGISIGFVLNHKL